MIMKFSSNAPIIHVSANTSPSLSAQAVVTISNKHDFSLNKYHPNVGPSTQAYPDSSQVPMNQQAPLPLSMDPILGMSELQINVYTTVHINFSIHYEPQSS